MEMMKKETNAISALEAALIQGDLSHLDDKSRIMYYNKVCDSMGLNPLSKPFEYVKLQGKTVLYANKGCAEQLRKIHGVSTRISEVKQIGDIYVVIVNACDKHGREDSATGAVCIKGLTGDALANAFMKAETKAKRRVTLSICGLNMLDESEVADIPDAKPMRDITPQPAKIAAKPVSNEDAARLMNLIKLTNISQAIVDGWLQKAQVETVGQLPAHTAAAIINKLEAKANEMSHQFDESEKYEMYN